MDYTTLISAAIAARECAYAPYSQFAVGAVVLTRDGTLFTGCNIENAAYPLTMCAERVALFHAYAMGQQDIVALAVVGATDDVISPCGGCRQVIFELAPHATIILANLRGQQRVVTPQELLPYGFGPGQLDESKRGS